MARYNTQNTGHYRKGALYPAGSVVEIPDNERPSATWTNEDGSPIDFSKWPPKEVSAASEDTKEFREELKDVLKSLSREVQRLNTRIGDLEASANAKTDGASKPEQAKPSDPASDAGKKGKHKDASPL